MLQRLNIGSRLFTGFMIMIILIAGVSGVTLYEMRVLSDLTTKLHDHPLTVSNAVRDVKAHILTMHRAMKVIVLTQDEIDIDKKLLEIEASEQDVQSLFTLIHDRFLGDVGDVQEVVTLFNQWKPIRNEIIALLKEGDEQQALDLSTGKEAEHLEMLEREMHDLIHFANTKAEIFLADAQSRKRQAYTLSLIMLGASILIGFVLAAKLTRTIVRPLRRAVEAVDDISEGNLDIQFKTTLHDEIGQLLAAIERMTTYIRDVADVAERIANQDLQVTIAPRSAHDVLNHSLQRMVMTLQVTIEELEYSMNEIEQQNWQKGGLNQLNSELLQQDSLEATCRKAVSFITHYVEGGYGVLYLYDQDQQVLKLAGTFAFTEQDQVHQRYRLGEGVIGQVAQERTPIFLKDLQGGNQFIVTGTTSEPPLNSYTFPLIYNEELYGVLEVAAFEPLDEMKQNFLNEANQVIAAVLFSAQQREQVQVLLDRSQQARQEAEQAAKEAQEAQEEAQQNTAELQRANAQMEEQQQQLQQQSEEFQQINAHLEEQQQQIQQQSEELRVQNESLQQAKAELEQRTRDLETAGRYKTDFLSSMSHDLRTPLNSIILLSKMLGKNEQETFNERQLKQIQVIHQAGEELLHLINDILELSKIEAGKVTAQPSTFSSRELLNGFIDIFHTTAEEKGLDFQVNDEFDSVITTDKEKLAKVIRNFLSNALKFTNDGQVTVTMAVSPKSQDYVYISVSDTGIGISAEKQQRIFELFEQADHAISKEVGGTGLGLTVAREYAKLLQGHIRVQSEWGMGSTFTLTIPINLTGGTPPDEVMPPAPEEASELSPPEPKEVLQDDREILEPSDTVILIIEDNADLTRTMINVVRDMGYKALAALNGSEGLQLAQQFQPTGILLDLVLPDKNGMELLTELKHIRDVQHIPVHIISSRKRDDRYRQAGAIGYYQKPVTDIDIQHAVENIITTLNKQPRTMLIVEDDDAQRETLQELFDDRAHIQVTGVASESAAIEALRTGDYDTAIIDLGLQEGSGYGVCQYVQQHQLLLPIIIYTARDVTDADKAELQAYADKIILKAAHSYERLLDEVSGFLHLPLHAAPPSSGEPQEAPRPATPSSSEMLETLEGYTVVIVDTDIKQVFFMASALEDVGASVLEASDGAAAYDLLHQEDTVHLMLINVTNSALDGYATIRKIRQDANMGHLPIIAVTSKTLKEERQKAIQAGADDYLAKPIEQDNLIRLVKAWISKHTEA